MAKESTGFASMEDDKQRQAASKGGHASRASKKSTSTGRKATSNLTNEDRRKSGMNSHGNSS